MRIRNCLQVALLFVAATSTALAQEKLADLSGVLGEIRVDQKIPALAAVVVSSEATLAEGVAGVRDVSKDVPVTIEDLWHIGSITKSFTSTLVAILVEEELIAWDDTLEDYLDSAAGTPYAEVTLAELASHSSGMVANPPNLWFQEARSSTLSLPEQRLDVVGDLLEQKPTSPHGTAFLYSNAGYVTLGTILEQTTDQPWEELVRERVLMPLSLKTAGFGAPGKNDPIDQPRGHTQGPGGKLVAVPPEPNADNPAALGPAGTLHMSIRDLARYAQEHLKGERGEGSLLSKETYQFLHRGGLGNYARGWVDKDQGWTEGERVFWHNGSNTLWYAIAVVAPDRDRAYVVASNGSISSQPAVHGAVQKLVKQLGPQKKARSDRN